MYRRILVPLDGSELAEAVFPYVGELVAALGLEAILYHVEESEEAKSTPMCRAYLDKAVETVKRRVQEVKRGIGIELRTEPAVSGELAIGSPADKILDCVEEKGVDLILIADHGCSGAKPGTIGSVADKLVRTAKVPVWLVRTGIPEKSAYDQWPKVTLLVPLGGSELAEEALPHVKTLIKQPSARRIEVVLLRVYELPTTPVYYVPEMAEVPLNWGEYPQQEKARRQKEAKRYLARVARRLRGEGITVRSKVVLGKAADEIVNYAAKNPNTVIVMVTLGRSGLRRLVYGSVTKNVLARVMSPMLLIKPRQKDSLEKKGE